ncbi:miz zinc finger domain containing protein [Ophiostoma piceae UAMH 11346]|uniref:Miz zinc finger domain containing protein n=1 Tax=Ophiostoma piceae (strain UAMH 11346) TaxID=1262450 RepID=S3CSX5_OPHP1|nr:miz zinc finger domain containing protein [Ophiostoma piceae UAMH 11346]
MAPDTSRKRGRSSRRLDAMPIFSSRSLPRFSSPSSSSSIKAPTVQRAHRKDTSFAAAEKEKQRYIGICLDTEGAGRRDEHKPQPPFLPARRLLEVRLILSDRAMAPPSASRSPNLQRAAATPGVSRTQIASSNRTANAFLGRRPSWLTAQKPKANLAPIESQAAPTMASVLPSLQEAPLPPVPEQIPSSQAELSQRSDSSLLSPAPTDEASPSNDEKDDSPVLSNRPLPSLRPGHSNEAGLDTAVSHQRRAQNENASVSPHTTKGGIGLGITAAGGHSQSDGTASSEVVPAREGQVMGPVAPPTSSPPPSSSLSNTPPASTGPEAGTTTSALPETSYTVTGLARFALIDPSPDGPEATPRPATEQSVQDVMQAAPNTTSLAPAPAPASTTTPIAAQAAIPSSAPSPALALIPALIPAPAPVAVIDLESSSETITSSSHMPARLPPATAGHNSYLPRLVATNRKPSPLFKYADYIGFIYEKTTLLNSEARLSADTEGPRLAIIVEACQTEDGFFILVHQLYCLWSVDRLTCYKYLKPMKTEAIDASFKVIELIFKRNELLRPSLRVWLASFPRSFNSMMSDPSPYSSVLPEVVAFLTCLPMHWNVLRLKVTQRGYPVLMDELVSQLFCLSPKLQTIIFTSSRRQLGVVEGKFSSMIEQLFGADQRAHNPEAGMFIGLPCDHFSDLEPINAPLIASYRNIVAQCKASLPKRGQAATNQAPTSVQVHNAQNRAGQAQPQSQPPVSWQQQQVQNQQAIAQTVISGFAQADQQQLVPIAPRQQQQQPPATQNATRPTSQHRSHNSTPQELADNRGQASWLATSDRIEAQNAFTAHAHHARQGQPAQHAQQGYQQTMHSAPGPATAPVSLSSFAEQMALQQILPNQQQAMQAIPTQARAAADRENATAMQTAEALHVTQIQQMQEMQQKIQQQMQQLGGIHAMRHMNPVQSSLQSPVPSPIQSPTLHQQNRSPDARQRPSASATFVADIMHGGALRQPRQQRQQVQSEQAALMQTDQINQAYPVPDVFQQAQIQREIQRQKNRANPTSRANQQGAHVQRQAAAPAKQPTGRSMFPPKGTIIPLGEYPHEPSDRRAVAMSLAQARCRSPSRVIVDADTKKAVRPELAGTRFYQFVQRLALGPAPTPARLYTYHLEFFVTEEEYALRAVKVTPEGELLPVEKHFDGSLQYRLRCCKGRAQGAATTESDWVTMNTSWPTNIFIKVNSHVVTARRKTHNGRDLPADITRLVRVGVNKLQVVISAPPQQPANSKLYIMGVDVIETASHQRVRSQIENYGVQDASITLNEIIGRLQRSASDDDDFALLQEDLSVDLADPFSARIFNTPVRGAQCQHMECFDLENWLKTRPSKPPQTCQHLVDCRCPKTPEPTLPDKWRCPICSRDARPASLRIDQFLVDVRRTLEATGKLGRVKSILVAKDGTWKPVVEDEDDDFDDDDDGTGQAADRPGLSAKKDKGKKRAAASPLRGEPAPKSARFSLGSGPVPGASGRRLSQAVEVIELDSD